MIASSPIAKLLAASGAVALHGAVIWGLAGDATVSIEGTTGAPEVSLGTSFADMADGVLSPDDAAEPIAPIAPAEVVQAAQRPEPVTSPEMARAEQPQAQMAAILRPEPVIPDSKTATPIRPVDSVEALPAEPLLSPSVPPQEIAPLEERAATAVARSLRPKSRSKSFEEAHKPAPAKPVAKAKPQKTTKTTKKQAAPKGNAQQTAKAGAASGSEATKTKTASAGKTTAKQSGNAAISSYPGKVMKKISRVRKPRVGQKGSAVVAFKIAQNGGLASVGLARSSGSGALDQAALDVIRKAAPFPPPPKGAQRSFTITIKGR